MISMSQDQCMPNIISRYAGLGILMKIKFQKNYLDFQLGGKKQPLHSLSVGTQQKNRKRRLPSPAVLRGYYDEKSTVFENKEITLEEIEPRLVLPSNPPASRCLPATKPGVRNNPELEKTIPNKPSAGLSSQSQISRVT